MGLMDGLKKTAASVAGEVKGAATAVGAEASKAGRVAQAQMKLKSLQGDVGEAEKALGQAAYGLAETDQLQTPALAEAVAKVREAKAAVAVKEAEIEAIKAEADQESGASPDAAAQDPAAGAASGPAGGDAPSSAGADTTKMPGS